MVGQQEEIQKISEVDVQGYKMKLLPIRNTPCKKKITKPAICKKEVTFMGNRWLKAPVCRLDSLNVIIPVFIKDESC